MALPFLLCFPDWFIYEGVFFTQQRPPSPLAPLPSSLLVPASPGAVLISEAWSHVFPGEMSPGRAPQELYPDPSPAPGHMGSRH